MVLCLALQLAAGVPDISVTKEWVAYQATLRKHPRLHVVVTTTALPVHPGDAETLDLFLSRNGEMAGTVGNGRWFWKDGQGIVIDDKRKTWAKAPWWSLTSLVSRLGLWQYAGIKWMPPEFMKLFPDRDVSLDRLTLESVPGKDRGPGPRWVGYRIGRYGVDSGFNDTIWFDTATLLPCQFARESIGRLAAQQFWSGVIRFTFDEPIPKIDLTPPAGYQEMKMPEFRGGTSNGLCP